MIFLNVFIYLNFRAQSLVLEQRRVEGGCIHHPFKLKWGVYYTPLLYRQFINSRTLLKLFNDELSPRGCIPPTNTKDTTLFLSVIKIRVRFAHPNGKVLCTPLVSSQSLYLPLLLVFQQQIDRLQIHLIRLQLQVLFADFFC